MNTDLAVTALSALAQPSRLALFRRLVELGPGGAVPGELLQPLDIAPATLSFHLRTLAQAGLIEAEPRGRHIHYRANFARMQALVGFLTENCCGGEPARCAPTADGAACVDGGAPNRISVPAAVCASEPASAPGRRRSAPPVIPTAPGASTTRPRGRR